MEPYFERFARGDVRERMLESFRESLRTLIDPATGVPWSEDEIRRATMQASRRWTEAENIDLVVQALQRRDAFLAQQIDPRRASAEFLENFHSKALELPQLEATGGFGFVRATGTAGSVYIDSTIIGDPSATRAVYRGKRYQVYQPATIGTDGEANVALQAIDTGTDTNLAVGTELEWENPPAGSDPKCTVVEDDFRGGTPLETHEDWGQRLFSAIARRPRQGNPGHFILWGRRASNAVGRVFVYPCALHAGSGIVAFTQKRGATKGPEGRIPTLATMTVAGGYITPPQSPVVPPIAHIVAVPVVGEPTNVALKLALGKGLPSGWASSTPWPAYSAAAAAILASPAPTSTTFRMSADTALPSVGTPQIMIWDATRSMFEKLAVVSITPVSGNYDVVLARAPESPLVAGAYISPYSARIASLNAGINGYFDSLGPGELVNLATDMRAARAFRRPTPAQENPYRLDTGLLDFIAEALGGQLPSGSSIAAASLYEPTIPTTASEGPNMLVPGKIAVYAT